MDTVGTSPHGSDGLPVRHGVPCTGLLPIWAVRPEEGTTDVQSVAALRWAARDAALNDDLSWSTWEVTHEDTRTLAGTAGMAIDPPVSEWLRSHPQTFEPSARCLPLPEQGLAVWKELGRYVVAVSVASQPAHFSTLVSTSLDHNAANEIKDLLLCLRASEIPLALDDARLWTSGRAGVRGTTHPDHRDHHRR